MHARVVDTDGNTDVDTYWDMIDFGYWRSFESNGVQIADSPSRLRVISYPEATCADNEEHSCYGQCYPILVRSATDVALGPKVFT